MCGEGGSGAAREARAACAGRCIGRVRAGPCCWRDRGGDFERRRKTTRSLVETERRRRIAVVADSLSVAAALIRSPS